jgi:DNA polymerase-3 subunit beta
MYKQDLGQGLESIKDAIIPNTSVEIMIKLLGKAKDIWGLSFSERGFQIGVKDTWRYKGKLIDGKYLDYKRVVPEENSKEVVFDREAVLESFKCANLLVNKSEPMMAMTLVPGEMTLSGVNAKYEKFEESIEVDYAGESLELGVNVTYLMEVFSALNTEQVVMQLESFNSPILIFGKGNTHTRYVVMPMNLMQN